MSGPRELLLANLPLIEQIVSLICRRKGMNPDEMEEFAASFKLRLIENDYAIIRAFQQRSSFATYIAAVIGRALLDHRNREWGKWRASAEAERLGDVAIRVERLLYRDERSPHEAFIVISAEIPAMTPAEFDDIVARLPVRVKRRRVDFNEVFFDPQQPDVAGAELAGCALVVSRVVCDYIDGLPEEDQLILRLRFDSEMNVSQIARALNLDQQFLYRRLYKHFAKLRTALEGAGVRGEDVADLIGKETDLLDFQLKSRGRRPSEGGREHGGESPGGTSS
jgi:RNA polymerase sigma factor for flagellar operon FliA